MTKSIVIAASFLDFDDHHSCLCVFSRQGDFTIIPVLVGSLTADKEQKYGRIFAKYLADPENLFVISSDFCHWGKFLCCETNHCKKQLDTCCNDDRVVRRIFRIAGQRFRFTHYDSSCGEIYQSIENLDRMVSTFLQKK